MECSTQSQCASAFWQKLIHRLYEDNEALIVPTLDGHLYVADSFIRDTKYTFYPHTYSGIQIEGLNYEPVLKEDQVFYFALHDVSVKDLVDQVTGLYGQLMAAFITSYTQSSGTRGVLHIEQIAEQDKDFDARLTKLLQDDFKTFYKSPSAVLPLFEGYQYEELSHSTAPTTDTRDFHDQINDVFELYAVAFGIPKVLITGELQDTSQAMDSLLTFGLDPLLGLIEDELNRKLFSREKLLNGTYVKWRTNRIRHIDILDVASDVEKLISSGFCCIDDIREVCGMDKLNEEWSKQYFMTKNFSTIDDLLQSVERSEEDGQENDSRVEGEISNPSTAREELKGFHDG